MGTGTGTGMGMEVRIGVQVRSRVEHVLDDFVRMLKVVFHACLPPLAWHIDTPHFCPIPHACPGVSKPHACPWLI